VSRNEPDAGEARDSTTLQSLERGLAVMELFSREHPSLTLSEAAELAGLTRATARRILLTLERLGYVKRANRHFAPTAKLLSIGYAYLSSLDLWEVAEPYMEDLAEQTGESCSAAILDGTEIVYVARVPAKRIMRVALSVGSRLPAYATSMGRVLLAGLDPEALAERLERIEIERLTATTVPDRKTLRRRIDEVREAGSAAVDQELEQGVRSAAVPIRDASQNVVAALNVSVHATRMTMQALRREVVPKLLRTAEAIEVDLSAQGWESAVR
jgi:IclR family transcriptional regulator, pca regulon regulatory protein